MHEGSSIIFTFYDVFLVKCTHDYIILQSFCTNELYITLYSNGTNMSKHVLRVHSSFNI